MPKNLTMIQEADEYNEKTESVINPGLRYQVSFDGKNPDFDYSVDQQSLSPNVGPNFLRGTQKAFYDQNMGNVSRITAIKQNDVSTSNFCDDSKIMDMLNNDNIFEEFDMGQLDEEEKQFLLIDKDSGKVYDLRNENHL